MKPPSLSELRALVRQLKLAASDALRQKDLAQAEELRRRVEALNTQIAEHLRTLRKLRERAN